MANEGSMSRLDEIIARHAEHEDRNSIESYTDAHKDRRYLLELLKDCQEGLRMIAEQTISPELFPDSEGDELCIKTSMVIAMALLRKLKS